MRLGRKAVSSLVSIIIMAVLLSLSLGLFASLLSSFANYADTLRRELDLVSEVIAEERMIVDASSNGTHVLLSLTNKASKEVTLPYVVFKHERRLHVDRIDLRVPPLSTIRFAVAIPQGFSKPSLEAVLVARRGSTYKVSFLSESSSNTSFIEPYLKVPYDDVCLINDVDVVDHLKGIVVASYENGGILMINVKQRSLLWSKEFLGSRTENVAFNEAFNATVSSVSTIREGGNKILSIIALRDGKLLSLHNFYDYIYRSSSVREYLHQPALTGRTQDFMIVPKGYFSGNYSSNYDWLLEVRAYVHIIRPSSPSVEEVLLQRVLILDLNTRITPSYYQSNPDVFPKFKAMGYVPVNKSFSVLLIGGAIYRDSEIVYVKYRCDTVKLGSNILVPPTLHALSNGSPSWYLSLNPCDISTPNFLSRINDVIVTASGPYLYFVDTNGQILKRIDYSPEKIVFLKFDENFNKLIVSLTNGNVLIFDNNLKEEKIISQRITSRIVDIVLVDSLKVIVFNETHAFNPEEFSYVITLPSKPYKAILLNAWGLLVASRSGLLYIKT